MKTKRNVFLKIVLFGLLIIAIFLILFQMKKNNNEQNIVIRKPAVSGYFYLAEKEKLSQQIDQLLGQVDDSIFQEKVKMMILPHASYQASGSVAAYGFKKIKGQKFNNIFIISPSHSQWFSGSALSPQEEWETPLGKIKVNKNLINKLIDKEKDIFVSENIHLEEHAIEVMLPFLQKVLDNFQIVPIIIGETNEKQISNLAKKIKENLTENDLVIISSDLSHYPLYEIANQVDNNTIESILTGDKEKFETAIRDLEKEDFPGLETCACGKNPIKVALILAKLMDWQEISLLKYANSGDILGNKEQVVGYATISFNKINLEKEEKLSKKEQETLIKVARESIKSYFTQKDFKIGDYSEKLNQPQGAFVTLKKKGQLRGCMGRIIEEERPLIEVVSEMAQAAAFEDSRFEPLKKEELNEIEIEISVLSSLKKINNPEEEIIIGQHGVLIKKGLYSGVFLPQVAIENNWDLEEFMNNLCQHKAGLDPDSWKKGDVDIFIFSSQVFKEK